jgi:hypothetical protein
MVWTLQFYHFTIWTDERPMVIYEFDEWGVPGILGQVLLGKTPYGLANRVQTLHADLIE